MALLLAVAALTLGAVACGGDDSSSSDDQTTTEAAMTEDTTTSGGGGSTSGTLEGETGPGFEIEVKQDGEDAETVSAQVRPRRTA